MILLTHSYAPQKDRLLGRLRKIEGQVRGVQKMLEEDRYCIDVLTQLSAIEKATHMVAWSILDAHTRGCVATAMHDTDNGHEKIDELMEIIRRFTK